VTGDSSTNSFWVAILTFGEGWHNNHHAVPQAARHGLTWWEVDPNWYGIWALRKVGLAWDISLQKLPKFGRAKEAGAAIPFQPIGEEHVAHEPAGD
jgi:stearoyl-CoA desaturase (delta-9 desaturase)